MLAFAAGIGLGPAGCGGGSGSTAWYLLTGGTRSGGGGASGNAATTGGSLQPTAGGDSGGSESSPPASGGGSSGGMATGGMATGGAATGGVADGCTNELATGLTLQQIAVYQSVKIPVMTDGAEVAAPSRNASVVQRRETALRAFVTVGSDWVARELSARFVLTPEGGTAAVYYQRKTISQSSVDADPATTFQVHVPPTGILGPLRYSVEVVECTPPSAAAGQARFPAAGDIDLGARATGGLEVRIIPIETNGLLPDTSDAALGGYADYLAALYPITDISFSVGTTLSAALPLDWNGLLDQIRALRASDQPAADVYYFGLVKPADTLAAFCATDCTTGVGYLVGGATEASVRAALGVGFADQISYETMAHELGHNHGRAHAPCSAAGDITGVDADYPYPGGLIGSWGYDSRTRALLDPTTHTDMMGYCAHPWISDYTYGAIATRVAAVNGLATARVLGRAAARWRILLVDQRGPHWGVPVEREVPPAGEAERATVYDQTGSELATVVVYRTAVADIGASMVMVPEPAPGWHAVSVSGEAPLPF